MPKASKLKYKFVGRSISNKYLRYKSEKPVRLRRIKALRDLDVWVDGALRKIKRGELGGWLQSEKNLSQSGNCWVGDEAVVYDNAVVSGNAVVADHAIVGGPPNFPLAIHSTKHTRLSIKGNVSICDSARISGCGLIKGAVCITGSADISSITMTITDHVKISNRVQISGYDVRLGGNVFLCDECSISDYACLDGYIRVCDHACISGNAIIKGCWDIGEFVCIDNSAQFISDAASNMYNPFSQVRGSVKFKGNAYITNTLDYINVGPVGSRHAFVTFYFDVNRDIRVSTGCYEGAISEFRDAVALKHNRESVHYRDYENVIDFAERTLLSRK
jgi:acetyltransferase-like isoleucine patch superfamily enzyme